MCVYAHVLFFCVFVCMCMCGLFVYAFVCVCLCVSVSVLECVSAYVGVCARVCVRLDVRIQVMFHALERDAVLEGFLSTSCARFRQTLQSVVCVPLGPRGLGPL